jgi:hypothetical protein
MRKVIATLVAGALAVGVAGFTMSAGASESGTQSSWTAWAAQFRPLYNAVHANIATWANTDTSTAPKGVLDALSVSELIADAGFASAADSPSAALNAEIVLFARTDSQSGAYMLICFGSGAAGPCDKASALVHASGTQWNRLIKVVKEHDAAP